MADYYYRNGFPHAKYSEQGKLEELRNVIKYDNSTILNRDEENNLVLKQTMHGLSVLWTYFPHYVEIKCDNRITPYELYSDRDKFEKVILKRLKYGDYITDSGVLKALKGFSGVGSVSNFRPTSASSLYDYFSKLLNREIVVWDCCAGWGGRMLGAYSTKNVSKYVGTEPSTKTFLGLLQLQEDLENVSGNKKSFLLNSRAETICFPQNTFDVVFTSPPYYDQEKYSDEKTQSFISYKTYDEWLEKFWKEIVIRSKRFLKDDGIFSFNISDTKRYNLSYDMFKIVEESGYTWENTIKYSLSQHMYAKKNGKFKTEPIYIFRK